MKKKNNRVLFIICGIVLILSLISYMFIKNESEIKNIRVEKYQNKDYYIIENDYNGTYDLQFIDLNEYINSPTFNKNDFEKKQVMNYSEYESYCEKWGINKIYSDKTMKYIVVSYLFYDTPILEARLAEVKYSENNVNLYIWDNTDGFTLDISAYSIVIPTENDVNNINVIGIYTSEEFDNIIKFDRPYAPNMSLEKPIIYLYPKKTTETTVKLLNDERITCSYPKYVDEWNVLAQPNGDLIDLDTGRNLYSLYYESESIEKFKVTKEGFVVKGEDSIKFLEEKLAILGLNERETEEFIIYWLPKLERNKYNYIRFATQEEINNNMPLDINPKPDTLIRVLMTFKGLEKPVNVKKQKLLTHKRYGFTVVEWGGVEIK